MSSRVDAASRRVYNGFLALRKSAVASIASAFDVIGYNPVMSHPIYRRDLAYIHAVGFGSFATGVAAEIVRLLRTSSIGIRRVVDAGCGAGQLTKVLMEAGFEVTAIDASGDLLEIARSAVPGARFVEASIYETPIPPCEAVVAIGEALSYHEGPDADNLLNRLFRNASSVLPSGGMLIFDLVELGDASLAGRIWSSGEDWAVMVETAEDQSEGTLVRRIETFRGDRDLYRRGCEVHRLRLFDAGAVCAQLSRQGFVVRTARSYGDHQLPPRRLAFFATRL